MLNLISHTHSKVYETKKKENAKRMKIFVKRAQCRLPFKKTKIKLKKQAHKNNSKL